MGRRLYASHNCSLGPGLWSGRRRCRFVHPGSLSSSPYQPEKHCVLVRIANQPPRLPCCRLSILHVRGLHPCGRYLRHPDELRDGRDIRARCCMRGCGARDGSFDSRVGFASVTERKICVVESSNVSVGLYKSSHFTLSHCRVLKKQTRFRILVNRRTK